MDVAACFRSGKHDFPVDEDEQHDARFNHAIDETGKQFGFVGAELLMHLVELLEADGKAQIDGGHKVLHFEIKEFNLNQKLRV